MPAPITLADTDRIIEASPIHLWTSVLSIGPTSWLAYAFAGRASIHTLTDRALATTTQVEQRYDVVVLTTTDRRHLQRGL